MLDALRHPVPYLAERYGGAAPSKATHREIREIHLFFPRCRAIAAPVLLFRLKREGYSSCRAAAAPGGLSVTCRR